MVGLGGLEPPTSPLSGARSNHLSYRPLNRVVTTNAQKPTTSLSTAFAVLSSESQVLVWAPERKWLGPL